MSTAPQGWQNPKTNWQAADIVHPSDFNRIEGNIQAIENGSRTLDPSQVPSGNSGSLRQILSWFANRIRAITGMANWWQAPPTTLTAAKSHIDAAAPHSGHETPTGAQAKVDAHANLTAAHSATSTATANRIIIRDSAGRAKVAAPSASDDIARKAEVDAVSSALNTHKSSADHDGRYYTKSQLNTSGGGGQVHWNNVTSKPSIPSNPVPVSQLKKAQGTMSSSVAGVFAVHQYAFASPLRGSRTSGTERSVGILLGAQNYSESSTRQWVGIRLEFETTRWGDTDQRPGLLSGSPVVPVTWDYLTASGHPRIWAALDDLGEIVSIWEAEDPADPEWPDEPPFEPEEGLVLVQVEAPDEKFLGAVAERLERAPMPQGFTRSIYAADPPPRAVRAMFARQLQERGLEEPPDIREALSIADRDRRYWYLQLYMRQASRLLHDHRASTLAPLYQEMCRVDRRTGRLVLR